MQTRPILRYVILSASMGAGHDGVARELARRLDATGNAVETVDLLDLLPWGLGPGLRWFYSQMLRYAPWMYELIYRALFVGRRRRLFNTSPLVRLAAPRVRRFLHDRRPDGVISTFHVASLVAGELRGRGELAAPSFVVVTDFAAHRLWLHPGNDLYLCVHPDVAKVAAEGSGREALAAGPVVTPRFRGRPGRADGVRRRLGLTDRDRIVLVAAGSWGVGTVEETVATIARSGHYVPVTLCGHNERLRRRLLRTGHGVALGWEDDVPALMAAAVALVDNAGGLTCMEAFAAGLPVVVYRPIPGHGRDGARTMAEVGVALLARDGQHLLASLDHLCDGGGERERLVRAATALFAADPAAVIAARAARPAAQV